MGRAKGQQHATDGFTAVFGARRSGRERLQLNRDDKTLLAVCLSTPGGLPDELEEVRYTRFSGIGFAYNSDDMHHLDSWPVEDESKTVHLVAGRSDGLSSNPNQPAWVVFTHDSDTDQTDEGEDITVYGDSANFDDAVKMINASLRDEGSETVVSADALRQRFFDDVEEAPRDLQPWHPPEDPEELQAVLKLAPDPAMFADFKQAARGVAHSYDTDTFRPLAAVTERKGCPDGYVVACKADALSERAGAHAFMSFYIDGDDEHIEMYVCKESADVDEVTDALDTELAGYDGSYTPGELADQVSFELRRLPQ